MTGAHSGVSTRPVETLLTQRALALLTGGPATAVALIEHVCQLPGAPPTVAEQMALALFADHPGFVRGADGRWALAPLAAVREREPASDDLRTLTYAVVDVETTGMRAWHGDRITEIAIVVVRGGMVADVFETLVNPERPIPPMITALTHITWDMVKHAPRFAEISDRVLGALAGRVFVAHNAGFDWRFVTAEIERATGRTLDGRRLCTVKLARRLLPQLRSRALDSVASYYGIDIAARHRAAGDAVATARVLLRLLSDARACGCADWMQVQELLRPPVRRKRRRRSALPRPVDRDTTA